MRNEQLLNRLMETPRIRNLGLKKEIVSSIIDSYDDIVLSILLENGHIELDSGMNMEVVKLTDRVHVLRGVSYKSNRKYKLKLTMENRVYDKIEEYYEKLNEEIE